MLLLRSAATRHAAVLALALSVGRAVPADVTLIRERLAVAQIVLAAGADETLVLAAEELNEHLRRMSGTSLPVVEQRVAGTPAVYLGSPDAEWAAARDLGSLRHTPHLQEIAL